ncbi:MAG: undecaprenyldiphospho-muramoylpentapeptide beta-N-acetylglucosaminyltransferase [Bdellovibrionales bacterium]|nr:undecaprenyldiphospho-muramoylpentapeptide beta-N-acetylglucosaminyltransferase [Bdellovibrionales bacterium]
MRLLIAAGGTGGHVIPALALAKKVKKKCPLAEIQFVGTSQGFEATAVPKEGFALQYIEIKGMKGYGFLSKVFRLALLPKAFWQSFCLLKKFQPDIVFGLGGYVSGPLLLLASFSKAYTAILEPNAASGFSNRWLGKFCDRVFVAFDCVAKDFSPKKVMYTGNPLREEILEVVAPDYEKKPWCILVFGGSQGARSINQAVVEMLASDPQCKKYHWIHQTGKHDFEWVRSAYENAGVDAQVKVFFEDMAQVYRESHVVIARSGSSVLEILAVGRPSVLIPYPYAADQHQKKNAQYIEEIGAAIVVMDENVRSGQLHESLKSMLSQSEKLKRMSEAATRGKKIDASECILNDFLQHLKPSV